MKTKVGGLLLAGCLLIAVLVGANPADYDPFFDSPHDTYHLLAKILPQDEWKTPTPGPNAEACRDVWDKGIACSDGKFYGNWGELQPEYCNNNHFLSDGKTLKPEAEKCKCNIAMTTDMKDCPMNAKGDPVAQVINGQTCQVYCREKDHCHCVNICDAVVMEPKKPVKPKKKN